MSIPRKALKRAASMIYDLLEIGIIDLSTNEEGVHQLTYMVNGQVFVVDDELIQYMIDEGLIETTEETDYN